MFLRTGQAAIVPPGCMVFLAGKGLLPEGFAPSDLDMQPDHLAANSWCLSHYLKSLNLICFF